MTTGRSGYPEPVERLIESFERLPGIGRRTATRLAFHVLKGSREEARTFSRAIEDTKERVACCSICYQLTETDPCEICTDARRDASTILVVEQPRDLMSIESTGIYTGVYHVLTGRIDPLAGVEPTDLTVGALFDRIEDPARNSRGVEVREVILGLNPTLEGDSTSLYLAEELARRGIRTSRLARGLPSGTQLEYASAAVLADAIEGRQSLGESTS
ncbi:MAG: recombination mediator RecR [Planctomycetota bacterium]|nr:recombination mediator RecR [Planctomycetota bacterium]|tara:strand:- start:56322 stop:56969 length:648 start_codon:yes stop_codon:yes gene_type:complete